MTYLVESTHSKEECLQALDDIVERSPDLLDRFEWGCAAGDHTGWALIEAESESDIRGRVPPSLSEKTRVVSVTKFTPEQIRSFHEK